MFARETKKPAFAGLFTKNDRTLKITVKPFDNDSVAVVDEQQFFSLHHVVLVMPSKLEESPYERNVFRLVNYLLLDH